MSLLLSATQDTCPADTPSPNTSSAGGSNPAALLLLLLQLLLFRPLAKPGQQDLFCFANSISAILPLTAARMQDASSSAG
jgi:hypothetical protein